MAFRAPTKEEDRGWLKQWIKHLRYRWVEERWDIEPPRKLNLPINLWQILFGMVALTKDTPQEIVTRDLDGRLLVYGKIEIAIG